MTDIAPPALAREMEGVPVAVVSPAGWRVFARASERVLERWDALGAADLTREQVTGPLGVLHALVREAAEGGEPPLHEFPASLPARRLLDAFRRAFLEVARAGEPPLSSEDLLGVFGGMERLQRAFERDASQRFMNRISGPDSLQLIVEVSHDMRSPLGSILFLAERLRKGQSGTVTPIQERQLGLIYSAAFGLSSLASDVMELARGGERLMDAQPIPFSVTDIFRSVYDIVVPIAEEKGLSVRLTPPPADLRVGYPAALNRVLLNLTTNALKFTAAGGVEVTATQTARSHVRFTVQDTGRGIPESVLSTLFDAFRRRQKPGDYYFSSAGLGLGICQTLVRRMGGELQVETELEKGTRFHFELDLPLPRRL